MSQISVGGGGGSSGLTIGTTTIAGGTDKHVLFDNAGILGEAADFTIISGQPNVPTGFQYLYNGANFGYIMQSVHSIYLGPTAGGSFGDTGGNNVGIGDGALKSISSGFNNCALGRNSLVSLTSGQNNFAMGSNSLFLAGTNNANVGVGTNTLQSASSDNNTAIGSTALQALTSGANETAIGEAALFTLRTGDHNIAIGVQTLVTVDGGAQNNAIGNFSLNDLTNGSHNVAIGHNTGRGITTGGNNTIVGAQVSGLTAALTGAIIFADGSGAIKLDYNNTNASKWTLSGNLIIPALSTPGTLVNDSSGNVTSSNTVLGMSRVSSQFNSTTNVLANITGLTATLSAGKSYAFRVYLHVSPDAVGGHQYAMGGTCTATSIIYQINSVNNSTNANIINSRQTALGGAVGVVSGTSDYTEIVGLITVANAGTLTVQFAQNVANGTSSVLVGSFMEVNDTP